MMFVHMMQNLLMNIESTNIYLLLISAFVALSLTLLILAIFTTKKADKISKEAQPKPITITSQDIKAIAGDDVMTTQLDLARAYIEMDKKQLAKKILEHVIENGDMTHKREANALILTLELS